MGPRGHELLGHTADIGMRASAPDLPALFEEAASALAEAAADVEAGPGEGAALSGRESIALEAQDLAALAFAWLNELIGLAETRGEALARTSVASVEQVTDGWRLVGHAWFVPFGVRESPGARARLDVKSATFHRLEVGPADGGWVLTAYLDV